MNKSQILRFITHHSTTNNNTDRRTTLKNVEIVYTKLQIPRVFSRFIILSKN